MQLDYVIAGNKTQRYRNIQRTKKRDSSSSDNSASSNSKLDFKPNLVQLLAYIT